MQNRKSDPLRQAEHTPEKWNQTETSVPDHNQNQNHNTKKVALGPNTKR